jgi:hypothetical protein
VKTCQTETELAPKDKVLALDAAQATAPVKAALAALAVEDLVAANVDVVLVAALDTHQI